ncbi:hypothetical protein [Sphingobium cloacae]|uniref:Terminase n=1 Tax=Sphingobium cloacae TaxID=120107 RepID=A0A1E1F6T6_9SPHN|nr:hypothetical protein [Sphingobium cloacae]BAV66220.1 hypothetical protein SCLO_1031800 [Sphingobium cloacae]
MTGEREKARPRLGGRAGDKAEAWVVQRNQRGVAGSGPQLRAVRKDGWTPARRKRFLETLAATCNVSEAARAAGKNLSSAYYQRRRDPGFAREWAQALNVGYAELETLLLRQSLFGVEDEELTLDGEGALKSRKVKRGHPHVVAVRLLLAHQAAVEKMRAAEMRDGPEAEEAIAKMRTLLEDVRRRRQSAGE